MSTKTSSDTSDREIVMSRTYPAPRDLVWEAFTNPKHVVHWWGPRGFSDITEVHEFKVGGEWKHSMVGPDGAKYPNKAIFQEIVPQERVVFRLGGGREQGPGTNFIATWTFETVEGNKTRLTGRLVFSSSQERDFVAKEFGAVEGGKQTLERLSEYLVKMDPENPPFSITREFNAPRDLVWAAWTEQEHLSQWFSPKGFTRVKAVMDLRPGGTYHYGMRSPDGKEMWGKWTFREIVPPQKIVLVAQFSDATGGMARHPLSATWPLELLSTTTLTEANGKTMLTLEWVPINATAEELATFKGARASMMGGWGGTFENLEAYLAAKK